MPRDLFAEQGVSLNQPRDLFAESGISVQPQSPNLFQRIGQDWNSREGQVANIPATDTMASQGLQTLAGGMGFMKDLGTEPVSSLMSILPQSIQNNLSHGGFATPGGPIQNAANISGQLLQNKLDQYAPQNTEARRNINALGTIASSEGSILPLAEGAIQGVPLVGTIAKSAGDGAIIAGKAAMSPMEGMKNIATGITARAPEEMDQAIQNMKSASSALYKKSEDAGAVFTPQTAQNISDSLNNIIPEAHTAASQKLYKATLDAIGGLKQDLAAGDVSLQTLDRHRQILGNIAKDITNPNRSQEALVAGDAIDAIDQQVNGLGKNNIVNGSIEAVDALKQARAQWAKSKKFETVSDVIQQAGGDQAKLKSGFARLYNNDKKMLGMTEAEKEAIRVASTNNMSEKIMKGLGRFGIDPGNVYLPLVSEGMGAISGHTMEGAALIGAGTAARAANKFIARGKAENVLRAIEKRP